MGIRSVVRRPTQRPSAFARSMITALTIGLAWQFVLVLLLVRREQGALRWCVLREMLWLRGPKSPKTGRRGGRLWLTVLPLIPPRCGE